MSNTFAVEEKNKNIGKRISFIIHILILLIAFFYYLPQVELDPEDEQPPFAVKVDFTFQESSLSKFAHEDEGAQRAKSESAPEETPEQPTQEQATEPEVIETTQPQVIDVPKPDIKMPTPVVTKDEVIETKTPIEESPVKVVEKPKTTTGKPVPTKPSTTSSTSSTSGSTSGTSTTKPSTVDGKVGGTGKGNTGTGAGKDKGDDGDAGAGNASDGTGAYDGSGDGVFGRKIVYRDQSAAKSATTVSGRVSVKVCINRAGLVTYVELNNAETTIRDKQTLKNYLKAARGYKFQPDLTAPKEQCGKMSFKVDNTVYNKLR